MKNNDIKNILSSTPAKPLPDGFNEKLRARLILEVQESVQIDATKFKNKKTSTKKINWKIYSSIAATFLICLLSYAVYSSADTLFPNLQTKSNLSTEYGANQFATMNETSGADNIELDETLADAVKKNSQIEKSDQIAPLDQSKQQTATDEKGTDQQAKAPMDNQTENQNISPASETTRKVVVDDSAKIEQNLNQAQPNEIFAEESKAVVVKKLSNYQFEWLTFDPNTSTMTIKILTDRQGNDINKDLAIKQIEPGNILVEEDWLGVFKEIK